MDSPSRLGHIEDYQRYGRQMILDDFGLPGELLPILQQRIKPFKLYYQVN